MAIHNDAQFILPFFEGYIKPVARRQHAMARDIPRDMREWVREVVGVYGYTVHLAAMEDDWFKTWRDKQSTYYVERLKLLLAHPPKIPGKIRWRKMMAL